MVACGCPAFCYLVFGLVLFGGGISLAIVFGVELGRVDTPEIFDCIVTVVGPLKYHPGGEGNDYYTITISFRFGPNNDSATDTDALCHDIPKNCSLQWIVGESAYCFFTEDSFYGSHDPNAHINYAHGMVILSILGIIMFAGPLMVGGVIVFFQLMFDKDMANGNVAFCGKNVLCPCCRTLVHEYQPVLLNDDQLGAE